MRRFAGFVALLPLLLLSSCSSSHDPNTIVLRISNWGGAGEDNEYEKLVQSFYRRFEKENPGTKIRIESNPDSYVQKMMLNFVAGTEPDLMVVDASSAAVFINNGVLADLAPYAAKDPDFSLDNFFPNVLNVGRRGDAIYTIPSDFTPMVMYYNKDLFDQAGVPYPKPGWNFEDFRETARKLTDKSKGKYGFVFSNWMPGWVMWLWNNDAEVLSENGERAEGYFNSQNAVGTISYLYDLIRKDQVAPLFSQAAAQGVDIFANGDAAMTINGHWGLVGYKTPPKDQAGKPRIDWKRLGVVELPHNTPESQTVMYSAGYGITKNSKNKELAWKFIKMWTSYELQLGYNKSGIAISARRDVAEELAKDPVERQFLEIVPSARPPAGSWVEGYDIVETQGRKAMDSIMNSNNPDIQAILTKAAQRIDHEFAKRL